MAYIGTPPINVVNGGTGATTLTGVLTGNGTSAITASAVTQHSVLVGGASNAINSIALTNGQVLIGNTGNDPTAATLSAGTGLSIANAAGSITINAAGGGLTWSVITADQTAAVNHGYICNKAGLLTLTMPSTSSVGDVVAIININTAAGAKFLSANPGQLQMGTSVATANTGSLASTALGDVLFLVCTVANTTWYAHSAQGNWTVA